MLDTQLIAQVRGEPPLVVQNDEFESWTALEDALGAEVDSIVISPGPGAPNVAKDVGISAGAARECQLPLLGVCLGHQLLAVTYGATVCRGAEPMHGRISEIRLVGDGGRLFTDIPASFRAVRYHSLVVEDDERLPKQIRVTARSEDGVIMAIEIDDTKRIAMGVQFHPESICSQFGAEMIANFLGTVNCHFINTPRVPKQLKASPSSMVEEQERCPNSLHICVEMIPGIEPKGENLGDDLGLVFAEVFPESSSPARFWLDSASRQGDARFSFMGSAAGPLAEVVEFYVESGDRALDAVANAKSPKCYLRHWSKQVGTNETSDVSIFHFLERRIEDLAAECTFSCEEKGDEKGLDSWDFPFPFSCGFVGYFGYGLRRLCGVNAEKKLCRSSEPVEQTEPKVGPQLCNADSFVPDSSFLFADRMLVWDHATESAWVITIENSEPKVGKTQREWREKTSEKVRNFFEKKACFEIGGKKTCREEISSLGDEKAAFPLKANVESDAYKECIETCLEEIRAGETYEICLTRQLGLESARFRTQAFDLYRTLRNANPAPYAAYFEVKSTGSAPDERGADFAVCCSSPERFLTVSTDGVIESKPIKGTIRRGDSAEEDHILAERLRTSVKDRAENLMIVDLVRNDLGQVCEIGSVHVPKLMEIESFANVHQMVSTVRGRLPGKSCKAVSAVRAAFPGGSMTGAPKLRTMEIIDRLEKNERGVYSGALGYLSLNGAADLNIVIRSAVVTPSGVSVGTGGAIVALSDPEEELAETNLKAAKLQSAVSRTTTVH